MTRVKALWLGCFATLMLMAGCTPNASTPAVRARLATLEEKSTKLEADLKVAVTARDDARQKSAATAVELARLTAELTSARQDRDTRLSERDAANGQLDQFRKGLRELINQVETSAPKSAVTSADGPTLPPAGL